MIHVHQQQHKGSADHRKVQQVTARQDQRLATDFSCQLAVRNNGTGKRDGTDEHTQKDLYFMDDTLRVRCEIVHRHV